MFLKALLKFLREEDFRKNLVVLSSRGSVKACSILFWFLGGCVGLLQN